MSLPDSKMLRNQGIYSDECRFDESELIFERSKSEEHSNRFQSYEKAQKLTKNKENES